MGPMLIGVLVGCVVGIVVLLLLWLALCNYAISKNGDDE